MTVSTKRRRKTDDYCNQADGTRQTCLFGLRSSFWTMEAESPNKQTTSNMSFGTLRSPPKPRLRRKLESVPKLAFCGFL
jgi:hypothetical protein